MNDEIECTVVRLNVVTIKDLDAVIEHISTISCLCTRLGIKIERSSRQGKEGQDNTNYEIYMDPTSHLVTERDLLIWY